jgi:hypothetical protein
VSKRRGQQDASRSGKRAKPRNVRACAYHPYEAALTTQEPCSLDVLATATPSPQPLRYSSSPYEAAPSVTILKELLKK